MEWIDIKDTSKFKERQTVLLSDGETMATGYFDQEDNEWYPDGVSSGYDCWLTFTPTKYMPIEP